MSLLLLPAAWLLAASGGQDSALVDGMIERSNALKSFVAVYRVHARSSEEDPSETEAVLRMVYRAPRDLLVEAGSEGNRVRCVIAGGRMSLFMPGRDGGPASYGIAEEESSVAQARSRIARSFGEQFPGLGDVGESPDLDVFVVFRAIPGTESKRPSFHCEAGVGRDKGPLLGWLGQLKRSKAVLASEGDALIWEAGEGIRITLQENTGFISKIEVTYRGETKTGLELMSLSTDDGIEDAEFRAPTPDPDAKDISESVGVALAVPKLMLTRGLIDRKIREGVDADTLEWTSDVRARLSKVLRVYYLEVAPLLCSGTVLWARSSVDKFCFWYQESKRAVPEGDVARADEVEEALVEWDARFRENLECAIEPYLAHAVPEVESTRAVKITAELRALDLEAAEAACRESVVEASLKYFTEQLERAKSGQLPPTKD